jgi:hypothetical protein
VDPARPPRAALDITDVTVPDAITPLLGHRLWEIRHGALRSLWCGALPWAPHQRATAACHHPQGPLASRLTGRDLPLHAAPDPRCSCGIYAASAPEDLPTDWSGTRNVVVCGTVALWGRVVVAERGWRGQFACPVSLTYEPCPGWRGKTNLSDPEWRRFAIAEVARRYQLPVLETGREVLDARPGTRRALRAGRVTVRLPPVSLPVVEPRPRAAHFVGTSTLKTEAGMFLGDKLVAVTRSVLVWLPSTVWRECGLTKTVSEEPGHRVARERPSPWQESASSHADIRFCS